MGRKGESIFKRKDGRYEARYIKAYNGDLAIYGYLYGKTYLNEDMIEFYMGEFFSLVDYKARLGLPITDLESDLVSEFYSKYKEFTR